MGILRYQLRQKILSLGDSYAIKDDMNNERFYVRSELFSFGHKLSIEDLNGNEVAFIEQKLLNFMPTYNIYLGGNYAARVKKELSFFRPSFYIESSNGSYEMRGEIFSHDFEITKGRRTVAQVSKEWFAFSDTYGVDILDDENQVLILAITIVLDEVLYGDNRD